MYTLQGGPKSEPPNFIISKLLQIFTILQNSFTSTLRVNLQYIDHHDALRQPMRLSFSKLRIKL